LLRSALLDGSTNIVGGVYDMNTGQVHMVDLGLDVYGRF
jgi:hypothetical protein